MSENNTELNLNSKCSCVKEISGRVPVGRVIEKLDSLFGKNDIEGAGRLLEFWENEARNMNDRKGLLSILDEEIGYFRRTGEHEKAYRSVLEAFELIDTLGMKDSLSGATIYLNGATTLRASGHADMALPYYAAAKTVYEKRLSEKDCRMAAFYNNIAATYEELGMYGEAEKSYLRAVDILSENNDIHGDAAVSYVNLACLYYKIDPADERIYNAMEAAEQILLSDGCTHDGEFAFTLSKCISAFEFFGYFSTEKILKGMMESIYERA